MDAPWVIWFPCIVCAIRSRVDTLVESFQVKCPANKSFDNQAMDYPIHNYFIRMIKMMMMTTTTTTTTTAPDRGNSDASSWNNAGSNHAMSPNPMAGRQLSPPFPSQTMQARSSHDVHYDGNISYPRHAASHGYVYSQHPLQRSSTMPPQEYLYNHHLHHPMHAAPSPFIAPAPSNESCSPYAMYTHSNMSSFDSSSGSPPQYRPPIMNVGSAPHHPMYYPPPYPYNMYGYPPPGMMMMSPPIEYITAIEPEDVLSGRGGATNSHSGNREFRRLVKKHQNEYLEAKKRDKPAVATMIVDLIRSKGGRFLRRLDQTNRIGQVLYVDIGDERAKEKTCQALREGAPALRRKQAASASDESMDSREGGDDKKKEVAVTTEAMEPDDGAEETTVKTEKPSSIAIKVTPNKTRIVRESESAFDSPQSLSHHDHEETPIMIRPCARLMPNRPPVAPIPLDHLSPENREMYLRDFLPPSNPPRLMSSQSFSGSLNDEKDHSADKDRVATWPYVTV